MVAAVRWSLVLLFVWFAQAVCLTAYSSPDGGIISLTGRQKRQLRSIASRLAAEKQLRSVIVSESTRSADEISSQLDAGELVRARFQLADSKKEVSAAAAELAHLLGNVCVAQVLGHTALFYRPSSRRMIELDPPV